MNTTTTTFGKTLVGVGLAIALGAGTVACGERAPSPEPQAESEDVGTALSDTAITATVKARLMREESIESAEIHVTTTNGVVTLEGTVGSAAAKASAEDAAMSVDGVKSVDNNLVTPSNNEQVAEASRIASDTWITTKVKSLLLADSVSKGFEVNVDTKDGVVALSGSLESENDIQHVRDIAAEVEGVKSVDTSNLTVAQSD
jgi:hyperosmotically inducible periplasmic protein